MRQLYGWSDGMRARAREPRQAAGIGTSPRQHAACCTSWRAGSWWKERAAEDRAVGGQDYGEVGGRVVSVGGQEQRIAVGRH
jgi:hypothetical protein